MRHSVFATLIAVPLLSIFSVHALAGQLIEEYSAYWGHGNTGYYLEVSTR